MKKLIIIMMLCLMVVPSFGLEPELQLNDDVYRVGQEIILTGDNLEMETIQIMVTNSDGSSLYNVEQIDVINNKISYGFKLPDEAGVGSYKIKTSINQTLTFDVARPYRAPSVSRSISIKSNLIELEVGAGSIESTYELEVSLKGTSSNQVIWSCDDESIATVDQNGLVTAVASGKTIVTAKIKNTLISDQVSIAVYLVEEEETPLGAISFSKPYMSGFPDGTFRPNATITRAELAVVYSKILGLNTSAKTTQKFNDVTSDHWAFNYVQAVGRAGIFSGYEDGSFKPEATLTRGELAATFSKFWSFNKIDVASDQIKGITDVSSHWAKEHIFKLYHAKVVDSSMVKYEPESPAKRGQVVKMVNALLGRKNTISTTSKFSDVEDTSLIGAIEAATQATLID